MLSTSYEKDYIRKTNNVFTTDEITKFLSEAPNEFDYIHLKCICCVCLRCAELVAINVEDVEKDDTTVIFVSFIYVS